MHIKKTRWCHVLIWLVAAGMVSHPRCSAEEAESHRLVIRADEAFEQGQGAWGARLNDGGAAILYDRVLVEDDGPGIGSDADWLKTDRAPTTEIAGNTRIKKVLHIERLGAREARLCVPADMAIEVNGRAIEISGSTPFPQVPISRLKQGDNEVVLSCPGSSRNIKIALPEDILRNAPERKDRPRRSFKSLDGGKTWEPIQGEYMVRLHLVQYVPQGYFISPVIDLGQPNEGNRPLLSPVSIQSVSLDANAETPDGTRVELAVRTGRSPVYEAALWSDWQPAGTAVPKENRYLQWKATLFSNDPLKTPLLRSVAVEARVGVAPTPAWANGLRVVSFHSEAIRSTSLPFEYEDPFHPRLVALRRKYKLDDVVSGARTETEQMVRLRDWVSRQWKYTAPELNYPAWDADEILTRKYGFCVQYAIVLMQSAISLGHQARFVFGHNPGAFDGGGHEVCEVWSNEHCKWILLDPNQNWHYVHPQTNVPMSMLEVHDLILKTYYGGQPASLANPPRRRQPSDAIAICYRTSMTPGMPPKGFDTQYADGRYTAPTRWLFVNYVPRNNFYAKPYPQPKTQGAHWDWSEYWCWEDAMTPQQWLYRNFTARRSDLNWTINQVCFDATISDRPRALAIQMGTFTPYFDTFLVKVDPQAWKESSRVFTWELHPGRNRMEMRIRNKAGVEGPVSYLEVECTAVPMLL
jgi:transglutaminase-like putative cysteine protease